MPHLQLLIFQIKGNPIYNVDNYFVESVLNPANCWTVIHVCFFLIIFLFHNMIISWFWCFVDFFFHLSHCGFFLSRVVGEQ